MFLNRRNTDTFHTCTGMTQAHEIIDTQVQFFEKLLNRIRQRREIRREGGSSSKSNWIQLDLRSTDEE
ncbi:Hypothetical protein SMAX5B_013541 [Scophthalmus maximus]|uniref:Uncharacterized protein n=1 Tax=Scophthalmus maximus TaxID=52904 RepID=A0A2U9AWL0_SCOMX|nr:Hypothetical protein SMAX5B_013541 [Scophthalmus maximus]KAF0046071.1 hypothetical protein F2P81_002600 [Scophthalmus maximus]